MKLYNNVRNNSLKKLFTEKDLDNYKLEQIFKIKKFNNSEFTKTFYARLLSNANFELFRYFTAMISLMGPCIIVFIAKKRMV